MNRSPPLAVLLVSTLASLFGTSAYAQTVAAPYNASYNVATLGAIPGIPASYGGLSFKSDDTDTLLVGGAADSAGAGVYKVKLTRDAAHHVVGFAGNGSLLATAPFLDGGLSYGPDGILFYTRWPSNEVGQIKAGSGVTNKVVSLTTLGASVSVGTVRFVPDGFPGAGTMKTISTTGDWNEITFAADGNGTYNLTAATKRGTLPGSPEGLAYVPAGSPQFAAPSIVVCEFNASTVATYQVDTRGDAIGSTRKPFVTSVTKPEGAVVDPVTNDLLFTTFGSGSKLIVVGGFAPPVVDSDQDGVADSTDNCPTVANADQLDTDADRAGDACDADDDNDGFVDTADAFPKDPREHADTDGDGVGDNSDSCPTDNPNDGDGDGVCSSADVCPAVFDPDQSDFDLDGLGDLCDPDWDGDGVLDAVDLCIGFNDGVDADHDGIPDGPDIHGDPCDVCPHDAQNDADQDSLCGDVDNCPAVANLNQADFDHDGPGDACDDDDDNDTVPDLADLFPHDPTEWADTDLDGVGDNHDYCRGNDVAGDSDLDGTCDDLDALPHDPTEISDQDGDGVGDNADLFDEDPTEWSDGDHDGVGDNGDACRGDDASGDSDDDLVCDDSDLCPTDSHDADADGDLVCDVVDVCVGMANVDADGDQICDDLDLCAGNDATGDTDFDGLCDANDDCPVDANADQADADGDQIGDLCEADTDRDGVIDDLDDCDLAFDPDQANTDLDTWGDACDLDDDNDGVLDLLDNCPVLANTNQHDADHDGLGDPCDGDDDADGVLDLTDACPATPLNVLFDTTGCSGIQRIDRSCGPPQCTTLRGYVEHLACVVQTSNVVRIAGLITSRERAVILRDAVLGCWW